MEPGHSRNRMPLNRFCMRITLIRRLFFKSKKWWFYIDVADSMSKQSFRLIKFIVRLRINPEGIQQQVPVLTVPVG